MYSSLKRKYPALVNRGRDLIQQNNARPHMSGMTRNKVERLEGIELLHRPSYNPDFAPSDYHMFSPMASFFRGRRFSNVDNPKRVFLDFLSSKSKQWYQNGIVRGFFM